VDLIPPKTCTYDCLYCQVGKTTHQTIETKVHVPEDRVVGEIRKKLSKCTPDTITLAGSGEPTLHAGIGRVIDAIKALGETRVALLTNGALFWDARVRGRVLQADIILPTLTTVSDALFRRIHRPHPALSLARIVEGLKQLRQEYDGQLWMEVVLLAGLNDTDASLEGLQGLIQAIGPDRIQLNTVVRPPSDASARPVSRERLEEIKSLFGEKTDVIVDQNVERPRGREDALINDFLSMVKRRPLRSVDIANALGISINETEDLVKGLMLKGKIRSQKHSGDIYYLSREENVRT
jgi:wyosine [tRNA(Phe)-imidazoG37] synthetase (radical SAM superfamily)